MAPVAVAIMAKAPRAGEVKTRLCPPLSLADAAELYRRFLLDKIEQVRSLRTASLAIAYTPAEARVFFEEVAPGFVLVPQRGADLGDRLANSLGELLDKGHRGALAIDSDTPTLPLGFLQQALDLVTTPEIDVVLGPTEDGGYYLIGLRTVHDLWCRELRRVRGRPPVPRSRYCPPGPAVPVRGRPDDLGDAHGRGSCRGVGGGGGPARARGGDWLPGRPADSRERLSHEQEHHGRDRLPLPGRGDGEARRSSGRDGIHRDPPVPVPGRPRAGAVRRDRGQHDDHRRPPCRADQGHVVWPTGACGRGPRGHAVRVRCPVVAGLHPAARGPLPRDGNGPRGPLSHAPRRPRHGPYGRSTCGGFGSWGKLRMSVVLHL